MNRLTGIVRVNFELKSRLATVTYDPAKVTEEAVAQAIERANTQLSSENPPLDDARRLLGEGPQGKKP